MKDFLKFLFFGVTKSAGLKMLDPDTGEKREMAVGFNWQILFFGTFFGLPLFFKGLWLWAWGLFLLSSAQFVFLYKQFVRVLSATTVEQYEAAMQKAADPVESVIGYALAAIVLLLSFKANRWAVERLLKKGWHFENPSDFLVKRYAKQWKLSKHYLKPAKERETL